MIAADVHADEHRRDAAEEPVQVGGPHGRRVERPQSGRQEQTEHHARRQQRPCDDPSGAGHVPPQLIRHDCAPAPTGRPSVSTDQPRVVSTPSGSATSAAAPRLSTSSIPRLASRNTAFERASACQPAAATTVVASTGVRTLDSVTGSRRWWRRVPSARDPAPVQPGAGRDSTVAESNRGDGPASTPRVVDRDAPRLTVGCVAADTQITPDVHRHPVGAAFAELGAHEVGGEPFADATRVEPDTDRDAHGAGGLVDLDPVRAGAQRRCRRRGVARAAVETLDVAGPQHGTEERRVEPTVGDRVTIERRRTRRRVSSETTHGRPSAWLSRLTSLVGMKRLHRASRSSSRSRAGLDESDGSAHDGDVRRGSHGRERGVSSHATTCRRSRNRNAPKWLVELSGRGRRPVLRVFGLLGLSRSGTAWTTGAPTPRCSG